MSTDEFQSETDGGLPAATTVWEPLKPVCYLAGLLLVCTLLITLELVVRL